MRDILPRLKHGGFHSSLRDFPVSLRLARFGFHRTGSYSLSAGIDGESRRKNIFCCIDIAVMDNATFRACPDTYL